MKRYAYSENLNRKQVIYPTLKVICRGKYDIMAPPHRAKQLTVPQNRPGTLNIDMIMHLNNGQTST